MEKLQKWFRVSNWPDGAVCAPFVDHPSFDGWPYASPAPQPSGVGQIYGIGKSDLDLVKLDGPGVSRLFEQLRERGGYVLADDAILATSGVADADEEGAMMEGERFDGLS